MAPRRQFFFDQLERWQFDANGVVGPWPAKAVQQFPNRALALLIEMLALELGIDIRNLGSTTFKRGDLSRGFEPDSCFYIQQTAQIRGKDDIDLAVDPPPDLVIEVDVTHPSLDKLPLYAAVGVTEVWRYDGASVTIYILAQEAYTASETSQALPGVTSNILSQFIVESRQLRRPDWLRRVREWAQGQAASDAS
jgi:Uma2 family endonuclease